MKLVPSAVMASALAILLSGALLVACDARRRDFSSCYHEACADGFFCNADHRCVPGRLDAGTFDAYQRDGGINVEAAAVDVPIRFDLGADATSRMDVSVDADVTAADGRRPVDRSAASEAAVDTGFDAGVDLTIDVGVPDAPRSCGADSDCSSDRPFCLEGLCVACKTSGQCSGGTPVCSLLHACVSCVAVDAGCPAAAPACERGSGRCVECLADADCSGKPGRSFCVAGACVGCQAAMPDACAARDTTRAACLATGDCGECARDADCIAAGKPVCDASTHACRACASDDECVGTGPGVCLSKPNRHCATDEETVYVGAGGDARCSDSGAGVGSATVPYCTAQLALSAAKSRGIGLLLASGAIGGGMAGVSLTAPLLVVGKSAVITPSPGADGVTVVSGELTLRGITIQGSAGTSTGIGISAAPASGNSVTLHLDGCAITDNPGGGIWLNGAAFTITNTLVARNGSASGAWGGIQIQSLPATGSAMLSLVTIRDNKQVGLVCSQSIAAWNSNAGVLATGNFGGFDIDGRCGIVACATAGPDCGAQSGPMSGMISFGQP